MDGEKIDIQQLKLIDSEGAGDDQIQVIENGVYKGSYFWYTPAGTEDYVNKEGWYNEAGDQLIDYSLDFGDAVYIKASSDSIKVRTSGSVRFATLEVDLLPSGFNLVGNSTPNAINIQQIKLVGSAGTGDDQIQVIENGVYKGSYFWYTPAGTEDYVNKEGWYNEAGDQLIDVSFASGEGLYVKSSSSGIKYKLPALSK